MTPISIRNATPDDAKAIVDIYNPYILDSLVTFEEQSVTQQEMAGRILGVSEAELPWLVAEVEGRIVGYAYATRWRVRPAYRYSVESTVYLAPAAAGQGIGSRLYTELFLQLREKKIHVVIAGIVQPNAASVALHERLGFRKVAHFAEVGFKFGGWHDVGYWQLNL
jgi:L-amino acid N-acyltransferase YncA